MRSLRPGKRRRYRTIEREYPFLGQFFSIWLLEIVGVQKVTLQTEYAFLDQFSFRVATRDHGCVDRKYSFLHALFCNVLQSWTFLRSQSCCKQSIQFLVQFFFRVAARDRCCIEREPENKVQLFKIFFRMRKERERERERDLHTQIPPRYDAPRRRWAARPRPGGAASNTWFVLGRSAHRNVSNLLVSQFC